MGAFAQAQVRFWRAQAFLARHSGRFDLASQFEEYALAAESGRMFSGIGRGCDYHGDRDLAAHSVSFETAQLAINIAYTGHT